MLNEKDVQWVVNDSAELGVKINNQFFFLYKGHSLEYTGINDDGTPMRWRPVYKREFGECCHPLNYKTLEDFRDASDWQDMPRRAESE